MQPGQPGPDPYGQQPHQDPTAPQPQDPYAPPPSPPYGQQLTPPYGQQPISGQPYGQQPGQPHPQDPYAQQQPYGGAPTYPNAGYPQSQGQNNTLGLVSMILGIASIPLACCFSLGLPVGIAAVITGYLGKQKADQGLAGNAGQAKAGLICGAVGIGIGILAIILNLIGMGLPNQP